MKPIKLKDLLKENKKPIQKEALDDLDVNLPTAVNRFLEKLTAQLKTYNLPRKKEVLVIAKIIDGLNMDKQEVMRAIQKIKKSGALNEDEVVKNKKTGNVYVVKNMDPSKHDKPTPAEIDTAKKKNGGQLPQDDDSDSKFSGKATEKPSQQSKTLSGGDLTTSAEKNKQSQSGKVDNNLVIVDKPYVTDFGNHLQKKYDDKVIDGWNMKVDTPSPDNPYGKITFNKTETMIVTANPFNPLSTKKGSFSKNEIDVDVFFTEPGEEFTYKSIPFKSSGNVEEDEKNYMESIRKVLSTMKNESRVWDAVNGDAFG